MSARRFRFVKRMALLLLVACTKKPVPSTAPVVSVAPVVATPSATMSASATNPGSLCKTFPEEAKRAIASTLAKYPPQHPGDHVTPNTLVGFCVDTPNGAWRIEMPSSLSDVTTQTDASNAIEMGYVIAHLGRDGKRASFVPTGDHLTGYGIRLPQTPIVFDFDGDGEPELYVEVREEGDEGHRQTESSLVSFTKDHIERYGPSRSIPFETVADADKDGRPDLLILAGYTESLEGCQSGFPHAHAKPKFIARSLADGTFSATDPAAKTHAKSWCPAAPTAINGSYDAICARLWAKTPPEIAAARTLVKKSCVAGWCDRETTNAAQPKGASEDCELRQHWFEKPPLLTLP
jgi:hypothetical protein